MKQYHPNPHARCCMDLARPMTSHFVDRAFGPFFHFPLALYHRQFILGPAHYLYFFLSIMQLQLPDCYASP